MKTRHHPHRIPAHWLGTVFGLCLLGLTASGQAPRQAEARAFQVPIYDTRQRQIATLSGEGVSYGGSVVPLRSVRIDLYDDQGRTNVTILGTNCTYHLKEQQASSPDAVRLVTGDGQLTVDGRGFRWWQTNNDLVISNDVRTLWRGAAKTNAPAPGPLTLTSDTLRLQYESNRVNYRGHVQAATTNFTLTCQSLDLVRVAGSNVLDRIEAREEVVLTSARDGSRVWCEAADYRTDGGREEIRLSGTPHWADGRRKGEADLVLLDNTARTLEAFGNARLEFPRDEFANAGPLTIPGATEITNPAPVEISAPWFHLQFPATNGPIVQITAATNVVILDPGSESSAHAARLDYQRDAAIRLTGDPVWAGNGREVRGDVLSFLPQSRSLTARSNAVVRLPVSLLAHSDGSSKPSPSSTNQWIEIHSDFASVDDGTLRFGDRVRADWMENGKRLGELTCRSLGVPFASNRVQSIHASGGVEARQFPLAQPTGGTVSRNFSADSVRVEFGADGHATAAHAEGDVLAEQHEAKVAPATAVVERLMAQRVDAAFGASNHVDHAEAVGNVLLAQDKRQATAGRAVFDGTTNVLTLSEQPIVILPEGRMTGAETVSWDRRSNRFHAVGRFRSEWKNLPGATHVPVLPPRRR